MCIHGVCRRMHLYGDIYSSPGISMRQKQLLMAAFLAQANMHDQLFGHLIAVRLPSRTHGIQQASSTLCRMLQCACTVICS